MRKYDFYSDPSHGWLKVKRQELIDLGIKDKISGYSYEKGDAVFLEEDSDAPKFMDAWEAKHQVKLMNSQITFHIADRASRIRTFQPFTPTLYENEPTERILALQGKIEHANRQSKGSLEEESRIDDLSCELLKLEEQSQ